jgi:hypothetical protein
MLVTAAEDEDIPDYINKMKSAVEQVNLMWAHLFQDRR